jgi:hypothetical protein
MPDETRPNDGGLGAPAKRGRPRKAVAGDGASNGGTEPQGGNEESASRVESAPDASRISSGFAPIDPLNFPADTGSDSDRPRRGKGSRGPRKQKEEAVQNLTGLLKIERLLVTGCYFLGNIANAPELHLEEDEAAEISEALKELSKHYPIGMSEKAIAWVNFSFAVGGVFGPKVVAIYKRPKPRKEPTPIRVVSPIEPGPFMAQPEPVKSSIPLEAIPESPLESGDVQ